MTDIDNLIIESLKLQDEHFKQSKIYSELTAQIYKELKNSKAYRVEECGSLLVFRTYYKRNNIEYSARKLFKANFCRVRLCPMCIFRKSLKLRANLLKVLENAVLEKDYKLIHIVLTVKNCKSDKLQNTVNDMFKAFNLLVKRDVFLKSGKSAKNIIKGFFRNIEITYNRKTDEWHPHIHLIVAVSGDYFTSKGYITQDGWCKLWQSCIKTDYKPICFVEKCYFKNSEGEKIKNISEVDDIRKIVFEASKYVSKSCDYLDLNDIKLSKRNLLYLTIALRNKRLFAYGGELSRIKQELKLEDEEKGDFVHINDEDVSVELLEYFYEVYKWDKQSKDYFLQQSITEEEYKRIYGEEV